MSYMVSSGIDYFLEIGPGNALGGMVKRIDRNARVASIGDWDAVTSLSVN